MPSQKKGKSGGGGGEGNSQKPAEPKKAPQPADAVQKGGGAKLGSSNVPTKTDSAASQSSSKAGGSQQSVTPEMKNKNGSSVTQPQNQPGSQNQGKKKNKGGEKEAQTAPPPREKTVQELCRSSRDLSGLVEQVRAILPQFSADLTCEALIQNDEDVSATINYLLTHCHLAKPKSGKRKKKQKEESGRTLDEVEEEEQEQAEEVPETFKDAPEEQPVEEEREERIPTVAEKLALRLKKKLREIERIEDKFAREGKVDKMQLPKLERKTEILSELQNAQAEVEMERQQFAAEFEARTRAEAAARAEAARKVITETTAAAEQERQQRLWDQRQGAPAPTPAPVQQYRPEAPLTAPQQPRQPSECKGAELLSMLQTQKTPSGPNYQQAEQLAQDLSSGRWMHVQRFGTTQNQQSPVEQQSAPSQRPTATGNAHQNWSQAPSSQPVKQSWDDQTTWTEEDYCSTPLDPNSLTEEQRRQVDKKRFMDSYSTPLDSNSLTEEQRRQAERIAKEIEGGQNRSPEDRRNGGSGGGYGGGKKGGYGGGKKGGAYGNWNDDSSGGKGKRGGNKGDAKGKGKGRGKSGEGGSFSSNRVGGSPAEGNNPTLMASNRLDW